MMSFTKYRDNSTSETKQINCRKVQLFKIGSENKFPCHNQTIKEQHCARLQQNRISYNTTNANQRRHTQIAFAWLVSCLCSIILITTTTTIVIIISIMPIAFAASTSGPMVRLCIASVDPIKLSSQCVMCTRRGFPLTVIDCTGITGVNDLIANPLSVREATCLIYNCRRQVPDVKPEPYHGSVSHAATYRNNGQGPNYGPSITASGSQLYEMMPPSSFLGGGYSMLGAQAPGVAQTSPYMSRYGSRYHNHHSHSLRGSGASLAPLSSMTPKSLIGGSNLMPDRQQILPYALIPAPSTFPFGRRYKAALVPLFR